ncbi:Cas1p-domain-containing protein [Hypomontagnella submonticulosa]|nr:Cas1p-domain-containing protein [Hypomontagnella submonticulosa]
MAYQSRLWVVTWFTILVVISLLGYHKYYDYKSDPFHCRALLHNGKWSRPSLDGSRKWEAKGCHIVEYPPKATHDCLHGRRAVFIGDSAIRQLFWAAARRLDAKGLLAPAKHRDLSFDADSVKVEFIWDPWLNSTALKTILWALPTKPAYIYEYEETKGALPADLIVVGAPGLWAARYGGDDYLKLFVEGVQAVIPYLSSPTPKSQAVAGIGPRIFLAPVQNPEYDKLSPNRSVTITPDRIDAMNEYLSLLSPRRSLHVPWAFNQMSADPKNAFGVDGLHVSDYIATQKLDVVLNAYCNVEQRARSRYFKGTCCTEDPPNRIFWPVFFLGVLMAVYHVYNAHHRVVQNLVLIRANFGIIFTLLWCWACDGKSYLGKEERWYQEDDFVRVCLYWLIASILGCRRTTPPRSEELSLSIEEIKRHSPGYRGPGFLSREQSDEIKGLMQGFILLYHYHYASQTLWVYKIIRLFISGYFYLSGYGHTIYLLKTEDYSIRRFAALMFRINFLSALVSYMMGTTYSLYYFAPAITFWYCVMYITLGFFRSHNHRLLWLITKVVVAALLVDWFTSEPGPIKAVATFLRVVFRMSLDVEEMRFRLRLDRYIVFVGIMVAALVHKASTHRTRAVFTIGGLRLRLPRNAKVLLNITCVAALVTFFFITQNHPGFEEKRQYNEFHSLMSWAPILSFVVLRNSHSASRRFHLALPAALGRISLETYVLQHHIWLGRNAKEWLTLGIWESP